MRHRLTFAAALLLSAAPAFAQDVTPPAAPAAAPAADEPVRDKALDRLCLRETGTRIRHRAGKSNGRDCPSMQAGRAYTQDDLRSTGQADIAQALRMLDPSIR